MSKRSPRLQFTDEERAAPELKKVIQKADKKADKLEKAEAKIPKKTVKRKERVVDADGKVMTRLYFEEVDKKKLPSKLSHAVAAAPVNSVLETAHREIRQSEEDNVGVESAHKIEEFAEGGVRIADSAHRSHKLKPYRDAARAETAADKANLRALNKQAQRQNPQFSSSPYSRWQQKRAIKKEYMAAKAGKTGTGTAKATQKTAKSAKKPPKTQRSRLDFETALERCPDRSRPSSYRIVFAERRIFLLCDDAEWRFRYRSFHLSRRRCRYACGRSKVLCTGSGAAGVP